MADRWMRAVLVGVAIFRDANTFGVDLIYASGDVRRRRFYSADRAVRVFRLARRRINRGPLR